EEGDPQDKKAEAKKDDTTKDVKKAEVKKDEGKKDEKKAEAKKDEAKKDEKKAEAKKDEGKKDEKKAEAKKDEGNKDEKKAEAKKDEPAKVKFEIKVPTNAELAANLKGHLLLVHGDMDNNVHPANTIRLVDALIRANKRFDMLILPGKPHAFGDEQPYFTQRM